MTETQQDFQLAAVDFEMLAMIMGRQHGFIITPAKPADLLIVFSCADPEVGRKAAQLWHDGLVSHVLFSGNVGKDSAGLPALGITEAKFLASIAIAAGLPPEVITLEEEARNGMQNALFGLRLGLEKRLIDPNFHTVASLAPAQRSFRLYLELQHQMAQLGLMADRVAGLSSGVIDPKNPEMRVELLGELRGVCTMHNTEPPRIQRQPAFQPGGPYYGLVKRAGLAA